VQYTAESMKYKASFGYASEQPNCMNSGVVSANGCQRI